jgi:uncharacterized iron-regulated membrane protein
VVLLSRPGEDVIRRRHGVVLHRWTGSVLALFLLLVGLTGSVLPFYRNLDKALSPELLTVGVLARRPPLDPLVLREQVLARHPEFRIDSVPLAHKADEAMAFYVEGRSSRLTYDELYVDPYTGRELGTRRWGDLTQGRVNLMPFVYRLHYSLAAGTPGRTVLGVVALLWTLDCFVGACLTLPLRLPRREGLLVRRGKGWWSRWMQAWKLRFDAGWYRFGFDLHRAAGLWLWAMLFVIAWSAVSFNLSDIYRPVMGALLGPWDPAPTAVHRGQALDEQRLDWVQARFRARALMAELSAQSHFVVKREEALSLDRSAHAWRYVVTSDRDVSPQRGATHIVFDAHAGALLASHLPTGQNAAQTVTTWMTNLHTAHVGGLPARVVVSATGLLVAALSVTGVAILLRKRATRRKPSGRGAC